MPISLGPMLSTTSFWVPEYFCPSAWIEHAPFAFWLAEQLRPRAFVELGTHYGYSYFAFCQAIERACLGTAAYAVDNWQGDEHAGFYDESVYRAVVAHHARYSGFSTLMRTSFDDACAYFADGSIDLLHLDGRHFRDDVAHDFATWRPKLSADAIVLFHDINVRERGFGVWDFWHEVAVEYPSFSFIHGHGLGVLAPGAAAPAALAGLFKASRDEVDTIRAAYAALGQSLTVRYQLADWERRGAIAPEKSPLPNYDWAISATGVPIDSAAPVPDPAPPVSAAVAAPSRQTSPGSRAAPGCAARTVSGQPRSSRRADSTAPASPRR